MNPKVKTFIENHISLIDINDFDTLYEDAALELLDNRLISEMTNIILSCDLDPIKYLDYIPEGYMYNNQELTKIVIPNNIKNIATKAFAFCGHVIELHIPESISFIDYNAFCGLTKLKTIYFNSKNCTIENEAFDQCYQIEEVYYPGTVEEWKKFMDDTWCHELENAKLISCADGDIHND